MQSSLIVAFGVLVNLRHRLIYQLKINKMNDHQIYKIGFFLSFIFFLFLTEENYTDVLTKKSGKLVTVEIYSQPICGRSMNKMDVKYLNEIGFVDVSKNKCINGYYKVGELVDVIYHTGINHFVMPYLPINRIIFLNFLLY